MLRLNRTALVSVVAIGVPLGALLWLERRTLERFDLAAEYLMRTGSTQFSAAVAKQLHDDFVDSFYTLIEKVDHERIRRLDPEELGTTMQSLDGAVCFVDAMFVAPASLRDGEFLVYPMSVHGQPGSAPLHTVFDDPSFPAKMRRNVLPAAEKGYTVRFWEQEHAGKRYQVLVHLVYNWDNRSHFEAVLGFSVAMERLTGHYFPEVAQRLVAQHRVGLGSLPADPVFSVFRGGEELYRYGRSLRNQYEAEQRVPLLFVDTREFRIWNDDPPQPMVDLGIRTGYESGSVATVMRSQTAPLRWLLAGMSLLAIGGLWLAAQSTYRELHRARLKQELFSRLSHDAKTPLANIRLFADTLKERPTLSPAKSQQYYRILSTQAQRLSHQIGGMLDLAKMETGVRTYPKSPMDLKATMQCTYDAYRDELDQRGFQHELVLPPAEVSVMGDPDALEQLFGNLLDNAIKYSGDTRFLRVALGTENGSARADVTDRGVGIPPHEQAKVFRKFYRVQQSARTCHGSGLGLAIVAHLVRVHSGRLSVVSAVGEGTTFTVHLPLLRSTGDQ